MSSVKELRMRLKSLRSTNKITSAMKVVAAAKLKRSKDALTASKAYLKSFEEIVTELLKQKQNPLSKSTCEENTTLYVVFSSNRGLCGSFNTSIAKFFLEQVNCKSSDLIFSVGKKIGDTVKNANFSVKASFDEMVNEPLFTEIEKLSQEVLSTFTQGKVANVVIIYNEFISTLKQEVTQKQILPIEVRNESENNDDYLIEVDEDFFVNQVLLKKIAIELYQVFLHNAIGEHATRMTAMDSATTNAQDLISKLTIKMNRARQAMITTELTEIVSGSESLKN